MTCEPRSNGAFFLTIVHTHLKYFTDTSGRVMSAFPKSKIIPNTFTKEEISKLKFDLYSRSPAKIKNNIMDFNLDYHLEDSVTFKIVKPKIDALFGNDHCFASGCYKIAFRPYETHFDNQNFLNHSNVYSFSSTKQNEAAVLIPLVQGQYFNTVLFDVYSAEYHRMGKPLPSNFEQLNHNDLNLQHFDHFDDELAKQQLTKLPLDKIYNWHLGDLVIWHRDQLHCSTNFQKFHLNKEFIILFLA